jgi:membrane associated rhomboid family serine protease
VQNSLNGILFSFHYYILPIICILAGLWIIHAFNFITKFKLNQYGIVARDKRGVLGIMLCPFLHSDIDHLLSNSLYFIVLSLLICSYSFYVYMVSSIYIILLSGIFIWLMGRRNIVHIGASGLIMGYWGFLLSLAYIRPTDLSFILVIVAVIQCSQLIYSLFPGGKNISWSGHFFGFIAGILTCYILLN